MKDKNRILRKVLSVILSFAVILPATISLGGDGGKAQAKTSLPYIEGLKTASTTFNILEIVPAAGQGSIGYYIDGQEPCANWTQDVEAGTYGSTPATRTTNVNAYFTKLINTGVLSATADAAPLFLTANYAEAYPWQAHTNYSQLTLTTADTNVSATGSFSAVADGTGAFTQNSTLTLVAGTNPTGTHVQVIDYFSTDTTKQSGVKYYYAPVFTKISYPSSIATNTAVYTKEADNTFKYAGTVGDADFPGMEIGVDYYQVTANTVKPTTSKSGLNIYVAVSSSNRPKNSSDTSYFTVTNIVYTYVGTGGTYNLLSGSTNYTNIKCNTVYYKGGYTNNNWFLKNVFDWDTGDAVPNIKFNVTSVVGNSATAADVNAANLIVLSRGFDPSQTNGTPSATFPLASDIDKNNDLTSASSVTATIKAAAAGNVPVIVDNRLRGTNNATHLKALANSLYTTYSIGSYTNFVNKSVFFFATDGTRKALVTNQFSTIYTASDYNVSGSAFYAAYEVAVYENFIRDEENSTAGHLETDVNMARAIRYIINYKGQRVENGKSSINVLEIEPNNTQRLTASSYQALTGYTGGVTITCMSTLEFVGKNDDLIENYDAIYIGDNGGNALSDSKLDGNYLYENIGSPVTIRTDAVGLTDDEYSASTFTGSDGKTYNALKDPQNTRYSGNDLSTKKLAALNDYAIAGHPVIIADSLTCLGTITTTVSGTQTGVLTASPTVAGNFAYTTKSYQWYKNGSSLGSSARTATYSAASSGTYYCIVVYTVNSVDYSTTSNTLALTNYMVSKGSGATNSNPYPSSVNASYTAKLSTTSSDHFAVTFTPTLPSNINAAYSWEGSNLSQTRWSSIAGTESKLTDYTYYYYRCTVTLTGASPVLLSSVYYSYANSVSSQINIYNYSTFGVDVSTDITTSGVTLTAIDAPSDASYRWINGSGTTVGTESSISSLTSGTYYCQASITDDFLNGTYTARSSSYSIGTQASYTIVNQGGGTTKLLSPVVGQAFSIYDGLVDNCSKMYSFLDYNKSRGNVMRSSDIDEPALLRYTNTSEPKINLISYPAVYARAATAPYAVTSQLAQDPGSNPATYTLKYDFTITNPTDTTPDATRYYCNLYIDTDSDSRFIEQERIGNIEIHEVNSGVIGKIVDSGALKAGQEYIVTRMLSANMDGFLPWKLELIKVDAEKVHTSVTNYTYVKPTAETINILQINTGSGGTGLPLDTSMLINSTTIPDAGIRYTATAIRNLLTSINSDYDIKIQTCKTSDVNAIGEPNGSGGKKTMTNNLVTDNGVHPSYDNTSDFIYSYDMVIIGFEDCYQELDEETSTAIVNYLKDNHPILYSHDTTSMSNVPLVYDTASSSSTNYQSTGTYWGYYFNSVLRDPLGLDRYGVTNSVFGRTSKSGPLPSATTSGLVAADYSGLGTAVTSQKTTITPMGTAITSDVLKDEGYSIAYQPGSNSAGTGGTPIGTTQGFTNYMYNGNMTSTAVTQVNKGMITTYPFNLNTKSCGGTIDSISNDNISTMTILDTHQQYYQANMNPDDVLVWYCLSGTGYDYNDAESAYYIFSNGNATYSGFGHDLKNIGDDEAKLFVNSIIAAYRITNFPPVINFTDASGNNKLNAFLVPADSADAGGTLIPKSADASASDTSRYLYFTVDDSNVAKDKTVKAVVGYIYPDPSHPDDPNYDIEVAAPSARITIYNSQTNAVVTDSNLVSGLAYYIKIDDILNRIVDSGADIGDNCIKVQVTATTHVRGQDLPSVIESITLRKLVLFDLS